MEKYVDDIGNASPLKVRGLRQELKDIVKEEVKEHQDIIDDVTDNKDGPIAEGGGAAISDGRAATWDCKEQVKWLLSVAKYTVTGFLLPFLDFGTDLVVAVTHFYWGDWSWGALTLAFVGLPGLVCGLAIAVFGLKKEFNSRRLINYSLCVLLGPILYPFIQIFVSTYMVYLMVIRRDRAPVEVMGHDVKQFKALEGYLESGPQFVLQTYILLRGAKRGIGDLREEDLDRIGIILLSIGLSLASLTKTAVSVNKPDPEEKRRAVQTVGERSSRIRFVLTSVLFNGTCVVFRLSSAAFFYACLRAWANLVLLAVVAINAVVLVLAAGTSNFTVVLLLSAVSVVAPNGYLLYNFAGTFPVDFTFKQTRLFLFLHMALVTFVLSLAVAFVMAFYNFGEVHVNTHLEDTVLSSNLIFYGLGGSIQGLGLLQGLAFLLHWRASILPLYFPPPLQPSSAAAAVHHDATDDATETKENNGREIIELSTYHRPTNNEMTELDIMHTEELS